ncbi:hypothetical protein AB0K18_42760 [Nonomuraea sp. NPDC049421]|uniref:hypothetical protein n=1 Tax=Nonomuraea sp. NPDC049421 TaxID=3155275 RepID=UPI00341DD410
MEQRIITGPDELYSAETPDGINWAEEPDFRFLTEVDALQTLQQLGDDLRAARQQVKHLMRYIEAAAVAARTGTIQDGPVKPQAIIGHSGVSRETIYGMLRKHGLVDGDEGA